VAYQRASGREQRARRDHSRRLRRRLAKGGAIFAVNGQLTVGGSRFCTNRVYRTSRASRQKGGDYHEQSQAGSWHGGTWNKDNFTSLCIDTGDPADPRGVLEPMPNVGWRINMGRYGGTEQASKSPFGTSAVIFVR
jgi:hypothetical protein